MPKAVATVSDMLLPSLVKEAAAALSRATSAAEVLAARDMATATYDAAKRSARLKKAKGAHDELVAATYRVQADSLEIESLAKRRLADEFDAARPAEAGKGGRPKTVPDGNGFTAAEAGLSRKEVFEARQMRDVIEQDPGIVRRALDQMLAAGSEPTRAGLKRAANLRAAIGTDSATAAERGNNLYETPPEAMRTLLSFKRFTPKVWEPACGKGAISRMLEDAGYEVELSDLIDYGTADRQGEVQRVENFLQSAQPVEGDRPDIVTNPPYGTDLNAFVAHALRAHRPRRMALLLNLNFLCGFDDPDRNFAMDDNPPSRIYVFKRRLPMMHRDGWDGPEANSRMNTAWFVWELRPQPDGSESYDGATEMLRVDWKVFENSTPCGPIEAEPPKLPISLLVGEMAGRPEGGAVPPSDDDLYRQAVGLVVANDKPSPSFMQRRLQLSYNTAVSLLERMERDGIVSEANHAGKRAIVRSAAAGTVTVEELTEFKMLGAVADGIKVSGPLFETLKEQGLIWAGKELTVGGGKRLAELGRLIDAASEGDAVHVSGSREVPPSGLPAISPAGGEIGSVDAAPARKRRAKKAVPA